MSDPSVRPHASGEPEGPPGSAGHPGNTPTTATAVRDDLRRRITAGEFTITGPMSTGIRTFLGRTAVLGVENAGRTTGPRVEIVVTERGHEPMDLGIFTHCGIDPRQKRFIMLKSRIHYRAGFGPIASHVVECAGVGVTNADLSVYRYEKLKRPIYPLDLL